jgi:hypothetical protein
MFNKLNNLGFIIGVFFIIVALILFIGGLLSPALAHALNFYTGGAFLVFGVVMVAGSGRRKDE